MTKDYIGEKWKRLEFNFSYTNENRIEISNFGRVRTFNKTSDGNILKGSMINGYRIIRLKFFKPRKIVMQAKLNHLQKQVLKLAQKIITLKQKNEYADTIAEMTDLLNGLRKKLSQKFAADTKERTIHYHSLVHRLVAEHFLKQPSEAHSIVAHLDFNKLNNRVSNLKWMTPAQNYAHQQDSPYVIERKEIGRNTKENSGAAKLTITKVMLLKKLLNQGKPMRTLVKQFKITDTQILRIKRGENWGDIQSAR